MNREIKYKVWDKLKKEWFKPTYKAYKGKLEEVLISPSGYILLRTIDGLDATDKVQERFELMQYTGLKDSTKWGQLTEKEQKEWINNGKTKEEWKGKEICKGDILKLNEEEYAGDENIGVVEWMEQYCFWNISKVEDGLGDVLDCCWVEIIGNIHENKELIK